MARILDADTHIAEPPEMWDHLDPEWYARRPVVVSVPDDTLYGTSDHMWLIDGQIYPRIAGRGGNSLVTPTAQSRVKDRVDRRARELLDLPMRFEDMKVQGVDSQVVFPTLFLAYLTHDAAYEVALCYEYLVRYIGEDHLVVGTNYGHHNPATNDRLASDPSAQTHMIATLRNSKIAPSVVDRMLIDNPNALYGVS